MLTRLQAEDSTTGANFEIAGRAQNESAAQPDSWLRRTQFYFPVPCSAALRDQSVARHVRAGRAEAADCLLHRGCGPY